MPFHDEMLRAFALQNPVPISVSPDDQYLLLRSTFASDFALEVQERKSRKIIVHLSIPSKPVGLVWHPDSAAFAFMSDQDGDQKFRITLVDLKTGKSGQLDAPRTRSPQMLWSPMGDRLAYLYSEQVSVPQKLAVIEIHDPKASFQLLPGLIQERSRFAWDPKGRRLSFSDRDYPGAVSIAAPGSSKVLRVPIIGGGKVQAFSWAASGQRLVVTARAGNAEYFSLYEVDLEKNKSRLLAEEHADISDPWILPVGRSLIYRINTDAEGSVILFDGNGKDRQVLTPATGSWTVTDVTNKGRKIHLSLQARDTPTSLYEADLSRGSLSLIHSPSAILEVPAIESESIQIPFSDGLSIPAYLWRASRNSGSKPAALILLHGDSHGQALRFWNPVEQLIASRGVDVISLNFRGSSGYGRSFLEESGGHTQRIQDVLAAQQYAREKLGVQSRRIYLLGHSYGALLAQDTADLNPGSFGAVFLASYPVKGRKITATPATPVFVFHGKNDVLLKPQEAKELLDPVFFKAFENEGHNFQHPASWAEMYSQLMAWMSVDP